jgi:hypothetical protein
MAVRFWWVVAGCVLTATATAHADTCAVMIGNGTSDELVSVTVRAEFAPPGTEADRNLAVEIGRKLFKDQTVKVSWTCPTNKISYIATGLFANSIRRSSAPFTPRPSDSGALETAWVQ